MVFLLIPYGKTILFRLAIFIGLGTVVTTIIYFTPVPVGLATVVATILYFTPLPNQYPQSCSRTCHELDWPMICRVKLILERYQTLGGPCENCPKNATHCYLKNCISVDGETSGILTVNRQFPGPMLQVCQNDIIVVDIVNRVSGQSFGVHWRGQPQIETPYMDGMPMITQCPISSLTTFQYKFRASQPGTHMWQVNSGEEFLDTLFGSLIVRTPDSKEIHRNLYDIDSENNVMIIHSWNPKKENYLFEDDTLKIKLLINGKTQANGAPPSIFKVEPGKRYRFRVIYVEGFKNCQIRLSIDHHRIVVIALDGHSIQPQYISSATFFPGERLDFVLHADQKVAIYNVRITPIDCFALTPTFALLQYDTAKKIVSDVSETDDFFSDSYSFKHVEMRTSISKDCRTDSKKSDPICLEHIKAVEPIEKELKDDIVKTKFYFFYHTSLASYQNVSKTFFSGQGSISKVPLVNNLTMSLPSSPLLSQDQDVLSDDICNDNRIPLRCMNEPENVCECVHVVDVPLNSATELVLINQDNKDHIFHLHGYSFYLVGFYQLPSPTPTPDEIKNLDSNNKFFKRNLVSPVIKDTVGIASNSVAIVRFKADNPGYWLLDEEFWSHWSKKMSIVLKVGKKSNYPPLPRNFPKCGNWIGPEFFLD